ncbi:MAG: 30S ribosomal protein S1 [Deltaproteobacteria bacterium]|nr:30S ribosomal protein S1 [Deltaproteobacteria bacterium]
MRRQIILEDIGETTEGQAPVEEREREEDFSQFYEASLADVQEGEIVKGRVIQVYPDHIVVDIGYKSEGQIPVQEFIEQGQVTVKVGDTVDVLFERRENENGLVVLSKEKADQMRVWEEISKACEESQVVEGKIIQRIKGGLSVDIGVRAFLPGSQVDLRPVKNLDKMIGKTFRFKVIKFNKRRGNIVLSRRALLEEEKEALRKKTFSTLQEGQVLEGVVKNITEYGAFVDIGGVDGLLHITDMSWGRLGHPSEVVQVGERLKVKILKFDRETERVSLGLKQAQPDPWSNVAQKFPTGTRVRGRIVSVTDYGAFMELEEGVEGLIHVSEMSWTKRVKHPSKIVAVGEVVEAQVLDVDPVGKRISLGLKQVEPNPWDEIAVKYPPGTRIKGQGRNITDFGIFVRVEEGIDGLVHISDLSWTKKVKHPSELYKKGQIVEAMVLNIDRENERISLGVKQLRGDPWEEVPQKFRPGQQVTGKVTSLAEFGVFVELEEGVEGLIHISELSRDRVDDPAKVATVGQEVTAEILNVDVRERRIGLSIKAVERSAERSRVEEHQGSQEEPRARLGDLLREKLAEKEGSSE